MPAGLRTTAATELMHPLPNGTLRAVASFAIVVFAAGCSSTKTAETTEPKKTASEQEYKQVPTLGSWIPTKVKKGSGSSKETHVEDIDPEALDKVTQTGRTHQGAGGGK